MPEKTASTHMRLRWSTLLVLCIVLFLLGAVTVLGYQEFNSRGVPAGWLELSKADKDISVADDPLLKTSLPFPGAKIDGKARFIPVGEGQPAEKLGYLMHVSVPPVPLQGKAAPAMEAPQSQQASQSSQTPAAPPGVIISGFADAIYEGVLNFTLKDADGFVIDRLSSPGEKLVAGKDNTLQGFATQPESDQEASRVHTIVVELTVTRCLTCEH